jgi:hypothetical protein
VRGKRRQDGKKERRNKYNIRSRGQEGERREEERVDSRERKGGERRRVRRQYGREGGESEG